MGVASLASEAELLRIVATRVGYARMDTVVAWPEGGTGRDDFTILSNIQNVVGGFGVVGSVRYRSLAVTEK